MKKITYKDYKDFFGIYLSYKTRKLFCKLFFTKNKKEIEINEQRKTINSLEDLYNFKDDFYKRIDELCE